MTWYSKQRDHQKWRGTLAADYLEGDASKLTNLPAGTENDPIFIAQSAALGYIAAESDPIFIATSDALAYVPTGEESDPMWTAASNAYLLVTASAAHNIADHLDTTGTGTELDTLTDGSNADALHSHAGVGAETDPIFIGTSNALGYIPTGEESDPIFIAASAAYVQNEADPLWTAASNAYLLVAASGAWQGEIGASDALIASGAIWQHQVGASHAIIAHAADTTDPHGAAITQTSMAISGDGDASGAAVVRNVCIGVETTAGPANLYPQGTIYMKYTA